jgi:hypothetical protein
MLLDQRILYQSENNKQSWSKKKKKELNRNYKSILDGGCSNP